MLPGDARIVHHVIVYSLSNAAAESAAAALDTADPGIGYECFGGSGVSGSEPLALWAPGGGPTRFPNATGLLLAGGRRVVVQIHYNLASGSFPDRTRVELTISSAATTRHAAESRRTGTKSESGPARYPVKRSPASSRSAIRRSDNRNIHNGPNRDRSHDLHCAIHPGSHHHHPDFQILSGYPPS
ncbi:MAG: hypothetical protein WCJ30_02140 [Deltaproteobacteria bacterium]